MKNVYSKGKGKIHPSPAIPSDETAAVLRLLPVAILALTAVLNNEDKEVLAYMIMRSIGGAAAEEQRRCGRPLKLHPPRFYCSCFDCYTRFWSRWDCSPDRELIHEAIEAFEEHLASTERASRGKGRRRDRPERRKNKKGRDLEDKKTEIVAVAIEDTEEFAGEERGTKLETEVETGKKLFDTDEAPAPPTVNTVAVELASGGQEDIAVALHSAVCSERRRGWADVTAFLSSRLWNIWGPAD